MTKNEKAFSAHQRTCEHIDLLSSENLDEYVGSSSFTRRSTSSLLTFSFRALNGACNIKNSPVIQQSILLLLFPSSSQYSEINTFLPLFFVHQNVVCFLHLLHIIFKCTSLQVSHRNSKSQFHDFQ